MRKERTRTDRLFLVATVIFFFVFGFEAVWGEGKKDEYQVIIEPSEAQVMIGEQVQFTAALVDSQGISIDTTFLWSVNGDFGMIDETTGLFEALQKGQGFVFAEAGDLSGKAHVTVKQDTAGQNGKEEGSRMIIFPEDSTMVLGNQIQYSAYIVDSLGVVTDTVEASWERKGRDVGSIDADGLLTSTNTGVGLIKASYQKYHATTKVIVATEEMLADADSIHVRFRNRDGIQIGHLKRTAENDILKISGLPFPLNVLNGGELVFQPGSLPEDVMIDISIPDVATVFNDDSTVTYAEKILNGISFNVYVNGELVDPYYFDAPVELILPFKDELLAELGLTVDDLWMFFYTDAGDYNGDGITNVMVDSASNKIYAEVIHFSTLVIGDVQLQGATGINDEIPLPDEARLFDNYPNPFNPETSIRFELPGDQLQKVTLAVYNLLGQRVRTLVNGLEEPGVHSVRWYGTNDFGQSVSTGVYIYRLEVQGHVLTRRMLLMR